MPLPRDPNTGNFQVEVGYAPTAVLTIVNSGSASAVVTPGSVRVEANPTGGPMTDYAAVVALPEIPQTTAPTPQGVLLNPGNQNAFTFRFYPINLALGSYRLYFIFADNGRNIGYAVPGNNLIDVLGTPSLNAVSVTVS